ncbi:hypothetical protein D3875_20865 [Deinococcus cavernae]|uniref:Uncharacterized protein n=1 Tax=Deinococcus cavernae TaxID=2320857 RepID=A0A418V157_9DEIO|nr:hypothetical protein [Deinococcus cavernae]RJF69546.1 hypothetical protein D3875_20865 [Deinococcus cavernae]
MRSQFTPAAAAVNQAEFTEPLYAQTRRMQGWLLALCGLIALLLLTFGLMFLTGERPAQPCRHAPGQAGRPAHAAADGSTGGP